jgi:hypothetical protein
MNSPSAAPIDLRGAREPRLRLVPDYVQTAGEDAIDLAALAGLELDEWEQFVLLDALGEREDGKWAAFEVATVVPRQNGKGTILEARELAGLFLFGEKLLIHSAHEQATSSSHFLRLLNLIEGVPEFERRIDKAPKGKGAEAIILKNGQRILFKTRTGGGGRGLTGDFVALDEAMILPVATTAALVPTMAARSLHGNPQLWYAGSAVDQQKTEHGVVLARVRERAQRKAVRLAYFDFSAEGDDPGTVPDEVRTDPQVWAQANPGLGIRISVEHVENECNGALGPREFAVERLGIGDWPDTSGDAERVISAEAWAACAEGDESNRIAGLPTFAVDVNPDRTWGAIGVGGFRDDERPQVAVVDHERGTDWIVARCVALKDHYGRRVRFVVDKRGPAATLIDELKAERLRVVEATAEDYGRACGMFFDDVANAWLRYPAPQPELDEALAGARKAPLGDAWKWSRKNSTSPDISPLVAVTLARWGASVKSARPGVIDLNAALAAAET